MKSDEARGPEAAWLRRERIAHKWKEAEARTRLEAAAPGVSFASYRDIEAGNRKLTADQRVAVVRVFGAIPAFSSVAGSGQDALVTELHALVGEMRQQNKILLALVRVAYPDLMDALAQERAELEALVTRHASAEGTSLSLAPTPETPDTPERSEPSPRRPRRKAPQ